MGKIELTLPINWICLGFSWELVGESGNMLLTGTFERNVDDKLRLALPKPLRDVVEQGDLPGTLYIAPGTDGSLALYPEKSFEQLADKLANASPNAAGVRRFSRMFFARAQRVEIDKSGRVRIPPDLAKLGNVERTVVLVGVRDHIELWDKPLWDSYVEEHEPAYDQIAEHALDAEYVPNISRENQANKPLPR